MSLDDVEEVGAVEARCFSNPWPLSAYRRELKNEQQNYYIVLREDDRPGNGEPYHVDRGMPASRRHSLVPFLNRGGRDADRPTTPIIGFAGMWRVLDEAHVTTIGVLPEYQGRGLGELLFLELIDEAMRRQCTWLTLEVRVTNHTAQALYRKYGFSIQGRRPRYYSDNNEDAFIMWSESLKDESYRSSLEAHRRKLRRKLSFPAPSEV